MRRIVLTIMAALVALIGLVPVAPAAQANPSEKAAAYTYDVPIYDVPGSDAASERGPPAQSLNDTTYDPVDRRLHGASERRVSPAPPATTYAYPGPYVQVARATATTDGHAVLPIWDLSAFEGLHVAANGGEDTVSLFKASQRGLGESHYTNGYKPEDFPGNGAYFAREKEIADSYATHYGEGVIETRVPRGIYDEHFAQYEMKYLGSPPGTELAVPPHMLDFLSQFERIWH